MRAIAVSNNRPLGSTFRPDPPVQLKLNDGALDRTQEVLRDLSDGVQEALVLWVGLAVSATTAQITHLLALDCPASDRHLIVPMSERLAALDFVRQSELLIFADLHTHPSVAFLSDIDRARPFGSRNGFYAIVIPDFAIGKAPEGWAMYEADRGDWHSVSIDERISV